MAHRNLPFGFDGDSLEWGLYMREQTVLLARLVQLLEQLLSSLIIPLARILPQ